MLVSFIKFAQQENPIRGFSIHTFTSYTHTKVKVEVWTPCVVPSVGGSEGQGPGWGWAEGCKTALLQKPVLQLMCILIDDYFLN